MTGVTKCDQYVHVQQCNHSLDAQFFANLIDVLIGDRFCACAAGKSSKPKVIKPLVFITQNLF